MIPINAVVGLLLLTYILGYAYGRFTRGRDERRESAIAAARWERRGA